MNLHEYVGCMTLDVVLQIPKGYKVNVEELETTLDDNGEWELSEFESDLTYPQPYCIATFDVMISDNIIDVYQFCIVALSKCLREV